MKLLLLVPYALGTAPSQRYRIEQWAPHLERAGVRLDVRPLLTLAEQRMLHGPGGTPAKAGTLLRAMAVRLGQLRGVRGHDVIWIHRAAWPIGPAFVERLLAATGVPLIFEFDDAIYLTHTAAGNSRWSVLKCAAKTGEICRLSAHVVTGNEYLARYARQFTDSVTVVPSTVDTNRYQPRTSYASTGPVTIGWMGSRTTAPYLHRLDEVFLQLARRCDFRLHVIGSGEFALPGVNLHVTDWDAATEPADIRRYDIGVMPLPDEEWARGKCAMKALQYMAAGVPAVVSPVGVNADIIRHGHNGLLAGTPDEWVEQLATLCQDAALRERLGRAGRQTVEETYSAEAQAPRVLEILGRVAKRAPREAAQAQDVGTSPCR